MLECEARKSAPERLGRVCVLGLGKSGKAAARYCAELIGSRVESLFVAAGAKNPESAAFLESIAGCGITWAFGDDALAGCTEHFDVCIASPGIPYWHDLYTGALACCDEVISEVEFSWRESAADSVWVAITGTNGKTTTTACCAHILRACGFAAAAVGNIGEVCLDAVRAGATRVYVAEVSSYQLYSTARFSPDVAVLLNITPDHVHWHRTFEAYAEAKFNVLRLPQENSGDAPVAILDATNDIVRSKMDDVVGQAAGRVIVPVGSAAGLHAGIRDEPCDENAAFISEDDILTVDYAGVRHRLAAVPELLIEGEHNASNALAAATVAVVLGAEDDSITRALSTFSPLEHRIEPCGRVGGVHCYNDSKATNVDATLKALEAFPGRDVIVLLGGDDKGTDLDELVDSVRAHARVAVCFGAAGPRFADAVESSLKPDDDLACVRAAHLEEALDAALALSHEGDIVLLSPACASFDEFSSFEERGRVFKDLVRKRAGEGA